MGDDTSDKLWLGYTSMEKWTNAMSHGFDHPSREVAYKVIRDFVAGKKGLTFCEIGFGQAYDFEHCFRELEDAKQIRYAGADHTEDFVAWARIKFPARKWTKAEFLTLPNIYDITYTRHTLQHQSPDTYAECVREMLKHTQQLAVIGWHPRPEETEALSFIEGWCNRYAWKTCEEIANSCGFGVEETIVDYENSEDSVWAMKPR